MSQNCLKHQITIWASSKTKSLHYEQMKHEKTEETGEIKKVDFSRTKALFFLQSFCLKGQVQRCERKHLCRCC